MLFLYNTYYFSFIQSNQIQGSSKPCEPSLVSNATGDVDDEDEDDDEALDMEDFEETGFLDEQDPVSKFILRGKFEKHRE